MKGIKAVVPLCVAMVAGCGELRTIVAGNLPFLLGSIGSSDVTLELVNQTVFPVEPEVYVSSLEDITGGFFGNSVIEDLLTLDINRQPFGTLGPGESVSRTYDCDAIQVLMVHDAELQVGPGIHPRADSELFRYEEDFECGESLTVLYSMGLAGLDVTISRSPLFSLFGRPTRDAGGDVK